jgi:glutamine synthetase
MEVYLEQYCLSVGLEARTAIEMAKTIIFPAAIRYQGELASTCASLKAVGYVFDTNTLDKVTGLVKDLQDGIASLEALLAEHGGHSKLDHAKHLCSNVLPAMAAVRKTADTLEGIVADDLWPLATYQEMLFIM